MFKGVKGKYLNRDEVLNSISQEQVFHQYLNIYPQMGKFYKSPFRVDNIPGCRFAWHSGILYFVENSSFNGRLYWDVVDIVKYYEKCDYITALNILYSKKSVNQIPSSCKQPIIKRQPEIRFVKKNWPANNLFKLPGHILESEYIFLVDNYWITNEKGEWRKNIIHNPNFTTTIAYYFPDSNHVKLYFPEKEDFRWYSNCSNDDVFGYYKLKYYSEISDTLWITKSAKDRVTLEYYFDIPCIALQNEGCFIPEDKVFEMETLFKKFIFLYDNDLTGIYQSQKLAEKYNWEYRVIDVLPKDPYEMFITYGLKNTKDLIYASNNKFSHKGYPSRVVKDIEQSS